MKNRVAGPRERSASTEPRGWFGYVELVRVGLFPTCVVDTVAPDVGRASVRVLEGLGCDVVVPDGVTCCGQPAWNSGLVDDAAMVARQTLAALAEGIAADQFDVVCVPAGSCATMLRVFWVELFQLDADHVSVERAEALRSRVYEFGELVAELGGPGVPAPEPTDDVVAYHHSCHMLRELGVSEQPVAILTAAGREPVTWEGDDRCCGFGGTFSVKQPEIATAMADDKIDALVAAGADQLVGCDMSCLLHLRGRIDRRRDEITVRHLAQVLDPQEGRP